MSADADDYFFAYHLHIRRPPVGHGHWTCRWQAAVFQDQLPCGRHVCRPYRICSAAFCRGRIYVSRCKRLYHVSSCQTVRRSRFRPASLALRAIHLLTFQFLQHFAQVCLLEIQQPAESLRPLLTIFWARSTMQSEIGYIIKYKISDRYPENEGGES